MKSIFVRLRYPFSLLRSRRRQSCSRSLSQILLNAGGGNSSSIDVNTGGVIVVTCNGICSLVPTLIGGDQGTLQVTGSLGGFAINIPGRGSAGVAPPVRQTLNPIEVKNTAGAGTLNATFTSIDYTDLGPTFLLAASIINDIQIISSSTNFTANGNALNQCPPTR